MLREPIESTVLLYECHNYNVRVTYISADIGCDGFQNFGPVGYAYSGPGNGRAPLYSIDIGGSDYIISYDPNEVPGGSATLLGYVDTAKYRSQELPARDAAYFDTDEGPVVSIAPSNDANATTDTLSTSWESCTQEGSAGSCAFLHFSSQPGQTHSLSCSQDQQNTITALLRYGTNQRSTVRKLFIDTSNFSTSQLYIGDEATWASVRIESTGEAIPVCTVLSTGGLQIGAASDTSGILHNGSFESELTDWQFCQQDDLSVITNQSQHGTTAIEISGNNCIYQVVEIDPGKQYTGSCYARNIGAGASASVRLAIANSSYQTLTDNLFSVEGTEFQAYTGTLTAPEQSRYAVLTFASAEPAIVDNCSLVEVVEP